MAPSMRVRLSWIVVLLLPSLAFASGETVTEADAIRLFLEGSPRLRALPLLEQSAGAELRAEALPSNPAVTYEVEDAAGVRDEFLTVQQELPIGGRRKLARRSADAASASAGLAATREVQDRAYALKARFYEVLYRERALDRLERGREDLERVVRILNLREEAGEGSGYDLLRAEQELAVMRGETAEAEAAVSVARSRFGAFFDRELRMEDAELAGDLETIGRTPDPGAAVEHALSRRADLRALRAEMESRELETQAARRRRFPLPTLSAGWKRTDSLDLTDTGFVAGLTVPLPLFDRGRVTAARSAADRNRAELASEALRREIRGEVLSALARERAAKQTARHLARDVEQGAGELRAIAQLRYDEGEAGILELLDAFRTSLSMELRALAARHEAKRAEIERDHAIGIEVNP